MVFGIIFFEFYLNIPYLTIMSFLEYQLGKA